LLQQKVIIKNALSNRYLFRILKKKSISNWFNFFWIYSLF